MTDQFYFQSSHDTTETVKERITNIPFEHVSNASAIKRKNFSFLWTINNFKEFLDRKYEFVSPIYFGNVSSRTLKWKMIAYPENIHFEGVHLTLRLVMLSEIDESYSVKYTVSIMNNIGRQCKMKTREKVFRRCLDSDECTVVNNVNIIKHKLLSKESLIIKCELDLLECENLDDIATKPLGKLDSSVNIPYENLGSSASKPCEIPFGINRQNESVNIIPSMAQNMNDLSYVQVPEKSSENEKRVNAFIDKDSSLENNSEEFKISSCKIKGLETLSKDLKQLYFNTHQHDVIIYVDDGKLTAHEVILTSRSDYFKRVLLLQQKEITVLGINTVTLDAVLHYLYTGGLKQVTENCALDLLKASKLLELPCLENMITETYFCSRIKVNNVTNVFLMAKELKIESLTNSALKFMAENCDELTKTEQWNKLMKNDPHTAGEVLLAIAYFQKKAGNNASAV